ncbi:alcohol dehydrogenase catalytic domain-containing protein [Blastococcus sp. SYSU DS0552]
MAIGEVDEPVAAPGDALVDVHRVGICGSDVTAYRGRMGIARPGDVRGHEFSGVVSAVGSEADVAWVGRRVAVNSQVTCGACPACRRGEDNLCPDLQIIGVHRAGALAERVVVPVRNLAAVDDAVTPEMAATAEPLAQACHDVRLALQGRTRSALVIGAGSIGGLVVHAACLLGLDRVVVADPDPDRRAAALAAGAAAAVADVATAGEHAAGLPEAGYDAVFDVVGTQETRSAAVDLVRRGGRVIMVGLHTDVTELSWFPVIRREVTIVGANCFDRGDFELAVGWLQEGRVRPPETVAHVSLDEGPQAFADLAAGRVRAAKTFVRLAD